MSDRELLELAAKAAGIEIHFDDEGDCYRITSSGIRTYWDPRHFDGDALRLAVSLRLSPMMRTLGCDTTDLNGTAGAYEKWGGDPYAATRRAIVRAAAEIGKGIQLQTVEGVLEDNYYKSQAEAEELGRQMQEGGAA